MKKYLYLFALLFNAAPALAQTQGEFVIEIDPETGTFTKTGTTPIAGIHYIYPEVRAYDEVNGRMIFPGGDPIPDHLYSIDISDGSTVSSPMYPSAGTLGDLYEPQFDNTSENLFAIYKDDATSNYFLVTIDLVTGTHTLVGSNPILGINGMYQGMVTYNEIDHRYILYSGNSLLSIDALTGNVVDEPVLGLQPGQAITNMSFNNDNDTLYAMMRDNNAQVSYLSWIDPITGVITIIGSGTSQSYGGGSGTIDIANRRYIYSYYTGGNYYVGVMDLDNGSVLFHNEVVLSTIDNIYGLKYDNVREKLFAIHWDELITSTSVATLDGGSAVIYPDPASDELYIRLPKSYEKLSVSLYNVTGQLIRSHALGSAVQHTLSLQDISAGVYFLKFETPMESFSTRFVKQ